MSSDHDITTTRLINAPRARVFSAWTEPDKLVQWWGPKGFTNTFHEFNFVPGGVWKFIQHGPNGGAYKNESVFIEILEPERIVFQHVSPPRFKVTVIFEDRADQTELTWTMHFDSAAECEKVKTFAVAANDENLDRLEALLGRSKAKHEGVKT